MIIRHSLYKTPWAEALDVTAESIICTSGGGFNDPDDYVDGGDPLSSLKSFEF